MQQRTRNEQNNNNNSSNNCLYRNRVTPLLEEGGGHFKMAESSSNSSSSSAGKMTFGRTPPPSVEGDNEDYTISHSEEHADLARNQSGKHRTGNHDDDDFSNRRNVQTPSQFESSQDVVFN
ncbi:PREDICTED: uncharacterized protein LOC109585035 [Amphimedon queenslandica]|uniref:Uncharacterized protein n=1 Tax=Amphimedon queenslandica TaxID=400682 RepID=A0A1X7U249_AMPQE|nr:PREDICTED: uncharacterized protein LOC109585035 [Amphimedon queenslandica]|eukprot:XP_019856516.1 PREDICTED: uncharacterized protein LOC109585035 [Amphimedon queenslandica]